MSHHSSDAQSEIVKQLHEQLERIGQPVGATGKFPDGKIDEKDEGELRLAVARKGDIVVIDFGKPIAWVGLESPQLRSIISLLQTHLAAIEAGTPPIQVVEPMPITEEMGMHKAWYDQRPLSPTKLGEFVERLLGEFTHDYGTIVHAAASAALAAVRTVHQDPRQGGLTGFQASAIAYTFYAKWLHIEGPLRIVELADMLYPQCAEKFRTIPLETFRWLQDEAKKLIAQGGAKLSDDDDPVAPHPDVLAHWKRIADGEVPFGYQISE